MVRGDDTMKKRNLSAREELAEIKQRISNLETKLSLINEPLLVDALSYELLGLQMRLRYLISRAKVQMEK